MILLFSYFCGLIADLLTIFISVLILNIYFGTFFNKSQRKMSSILCWIIYICWQIYISRINILPAYINVLVSITFVCLICISTYEGAFIQKVLFSVLINVIWMLAEFLIGFAFILSKIQIYYSIPQFVGSLFSKLMTLILILVLRRFFKNENLLNISNKENLLLLMIPIGSMYVMYNIFTLNINVENGQRISESVTSLLLMMAINIIIFNLYLKLSKEKELEKHNTVYEQQLELCNRHIYENETIMKDFRNARHNLKQHFIVLIEMLEDKENKEASDYLRKLIDTEVLRNVGISKTGNIVVDSLINAKYCIATKLDIKFEVVVHIPMQLPFHGADISVLLGNILDNAIEAAIKIPEENRYIKCFMRYENSVLIITVINAFSGKVLKGKNGKLITNKSDSGNHGIGLESVNKIANKYHGSAIIEIKEETFVIKVVLYDLC